MKLKARAITDEFMPSVDQHYTEAEIRYEEILSYCPDAVATIGKNLLMRVIEDSISKSQANDWLIHGNKT